MSSSEISSPGFDAIRLSESPRLHGLTVVALCGGEETRLSSVTKGEIPKSLVPLGENRLIDYSVAPVIGAEKIIFGMGYNADQIRQYILGRSFNSDVVFTQEHTAGASSAVRAALQEYDVTGNTAIITTDNVVTGLDFADAYNFHRKTNAHLTLVATKAERADSQFDYTLINSKGSTRTAAIFPYTEDKIKNLILFAGIAICSPEMTEFIKKSTDVLPKLWGDLLVYLSALGDTHTYVPGNRLFQANVNTEGVLNAAKKVLGL